MVLRNTLKILSSNFSLTWKSGLYKVVSFFVVAFLCGVLVSPIFAELQSSGISGKLMTLIEGIFSFKGALIADTATDIAVALNDIVTGAYTVNIIVMIVLLFAVMPFLFSLSDMAECDVLYGSMSCNTRLHYVASFMGNLRASVKVALLKVACTLPYALVVLFVLYAIMNMILVGGLVTYLALFLMFFVIILAVALERAILGYLQPAVVVQGLGAHKAFVDGQKQNFRLFAKNFSIYFILSVIVFFVNAFVGIYTFGVGLIVTIPSSLICYNIVSMVMYCNAFGINYYVTPSEVYYSKKLDEQLDLKDMQYLL